MKLSRLRAVTSGYFVAPARERGLKYRIQNKEDVAGSSRSREGAWIEISRLLVSAAPVNGRSREGAWIEINIEAHKGDKNVVAPARERGLK